MCYQPSWDWYILSVCKRGASSDERKDTFFCSCVFSFWKLGWSFIFYLEKHRRVCAFVLDRYNRISYIAQDKKGKENGIRPYMKTMCPWTIQRSRWHFNHWYRKVLKEQKLFNKSDPFLWIYACVKKFPFFTPYFWFLQNKWSIRKLCQI